MDHPIETIFIFDSFSSPIDFELESKLISTAAKVILLSPHMKAEFKKFGIRSIPLSHYYQHESWDEVNNELYHSYRAIFKESPETGGSGESLDLLDCWSNFLVGETNSTFLILSALERIILSERPDKIDFISDHRGAIFEKYSKILSRFANHYHVTVSMNSIEV